MKTYKLLSALGAFIQTTTPGVLGGNSKAKIYGRLDCGAANAALDKGYAQHRVFFASEADAIANGYRPCGSCMREAYAEWKAG